MTTIEGPTAYADPCNWTARCPACKATQGRLTERDAEAFIERHTDRCYRVKASRDTTGAADE